MENRLHVEGLYRYPVKSMAGESLKKSSLDGCGLTADRRWMLVDKDGHFLSQRQIPAMALIQAVWENGHVRLRRRQTSQASHTTRHTVLHIRPEDFSRTTVACHIWRDTVPAHPAQDCVNQLLSQWLQTECRLVQLADTACRHVDKRYVPQGVYTGFADGFPLLVISRASLTDIGRRCGRQLDARHFRPNLVIGGCHAYAEDEWRELRIGPWRIHLVKPCSRCAITTVNPDTGRFNGPEPLATLATFRRQGNKVFFGQNAWAQWVCGESHKTETPVIHVGQTVLATNRALSACQTS